MRCLLIITTCYCFSTTLIMSELGVSTFTRISANGDEQVLTLHANTKSRIQCAFFCSDEMSKDCAGFHFDSTSKTCTLFRGMISLAGTSADLIYKKDYYCTGDGFRLIEEAGFQFCYRYIDIDMKKDDAASYCQGLNSYILHFDSLSEHVAMQTMVTVTSIGQYEGWVGANDLDLEGFWVTDKDEAPIDTSVWKWANTEPNNSSGGEHCAVIRFWTLKMNDVFCTAMRSIICEKTM